MYPFKIIIFLLLGSILFAQDDITKAGNKDSVEVIIGTFLGNETRNYYGNEAPEKLDVLWKIKLGSGKTKLASQNKILHWSGCGWTGQPLLVKENDSLFVIQGAFDYNLKKMDATNGNIIWQYKYDDVIKGTGTLWYNPETTSPDSQYVIMQGSRLGFNNTTHSKKIYSYRGVSLRSGKELWRLNSRKTRSYSRDVDGSAVILKDTVFIGLENSTLVSFYPTTNNLKKIDSLHYSPELLIDEQLYTQKDVKRHGGNLVVEASAAHLGNRIYISAGSGHVYGYNLITKKLDWDFYIGSDLDGTTVVTSDSCLLVSVEKQYIKGHGGVFKLDPSKPADSSCVEWYFPVEDIDFASWKGGVIGSSAVNDLTKPEGYPKLAAFHALDNYVYVVRYDVTENDSAKVWGPDKKHKYYKPQLVFKYKAGGSISTPLMVGNKLITTGYAGLRLFEYTKDLKFTLLDKFTPNAFESTPIVHDGKLYIGSKSGYMYCFGKKEK